MGEAKIRVWGRKWHPACVKTGEPAVGSQQGRSVEPLKGASLSLVFFALPVVPPAILQRIHVLSLFN